MKSSTLRVPASFRFQASLLDELKAKAKASNRSLNNYVECLLMDILGVSDKENELIITPELQKKLKRHVMNIRMEKPRFFKMLMTLLSGWIPYDIFNRIF